MRLSGFERISYSMGALGQNFVYGIMSSYLMIFYTDSFGLAAGIAGTLFLVARIWDAVFDPIIGLTVDRIQLRHGKFRPFVLVGGILTGAMTILCFFSPDAGMGEKVVYAFATYIIWGTCYGIMDVPYWSMAPAMSLDPLERTHIISISKITATVGMVLVSVLTIPLVDVFGKGNDAHGYLFTAVLYGALCSLGALAAVWGTRERIRVGPKKRETLAESFRVVTKNKPLLIVLLTSLFSGVSLTIKQTVAIYYFKYTIGNLDLLPIFALAALVPMVLAMIVVSPLTQRYGKKRVAIASGVLTCIASAFIYFSSNNLALIFIFNALSMVGIGIMAVLSMSMQADTVEYAEWKTGKRSESIIFSLGSFTGKLSTALGGAITAYWLSMAGYQANTTQTADSLQGINSMMSWAPAVGALLMTVAFCFYNLTEERHAQIIQQIEEQEQDSLLQPAVDQHK